MLADVLQATIIREICNNADFCIFRVPLKTHCCENDDLQTGDFFYTHFVSKVAKSNSTFHFADAAMLSKVSEFSETAVASLQCKSN